MSPVTPTRETDAKGKSPYLIYKHQLFYRYAFVEFEDAECAKEARDKLDNKKLLSREIQISVS
jgi:RNA recognition motif-containing protein